MRCSMTCVLFILSLLCLSGCMTAQQHRAAVSDENTGKLTVGTVQKEIRVGMFGAEVAGVLGAPNIVTTDDQRREAWVYDKISTEQAYSSSSGGVAALVLGGVSPVAGGVGAGFNKSAGASSSTQKTLTIIIKFDADGKVRDFAYHSSQF